MTKKILLSGGVIIVIALILGAATKLRHPPVATELAVPVVVATPTVVSSRPKVRSTASLSAWQSTDITAKNSGYISSIHFEEGQYVQKGEVLITLENSAEQAAVSSAQTDLGSAEKQYERSQQLAAKGYISKQDLDQAKTNFFTAKSTLATAQQNLNNTELTAPFAGYMGAKTISNGQFVNAGQVLVNLVDTHLIKAIYHLPGQWLAKIQLGQVVQVKVANTDQAFMGKVNFIAPNVDSQSNTIEVHSVLPNPHHQLTPGEYASVTQYLGSAQTALYVPENSVLQSLEGMYLFEVNHEVAVQTPVKIGEHHKGMVAIISGVQADSLIIVQGQYQVKDQMPVKVMP